MWSEDKGMAVIVRAPISISIWFYSSNGNIPVERNTQENPSQLYYCLKRQCAGCKIVGKKKGVFGGLAESSYYFDLMLQPKSANRSFHLTSSLQASSWLDACDEDVKWKLTLTWLDCQFNVNVTDKHREDKGSAVWGWELQFLFKFEETWKVSFDILITIILFAGLSQAAIVKIRAVRSHWELKPRAPYLKNTAYSTNRGQPVPWFFAFPSWYSLQKLVFNK